MLPPRREGSRNEDTDSYRNRAACRHRIVVIVTFLALLELIRIRVVKVFQSETFGAIFVSRAFTAVCDMDPAEDTEWRNL